MFLNYIVKNAHSVSKYHIHSERVQVSEDYKTDFKLLTDHKP